MRKPSEKTTINKRIIKNNKIKLFILYLFVYAAGLLVFLGSLFQVFGKPRVVEYSIPAPIFDNKPSISSKKSSGCATGLISCHIDGKINCISNDECDKQIKQSALNKSKPGIREDFASSPIEFTKPSEVDIETILVNRNKSYELCISNAELIFKSSKEEYQKRMKELADITQKNSESLASPLPSPSCPAQQTFVMTNENAKDFAKYLFEQPEPDPRCSLAYSEYMESSQIRIADQASSLLSQASDYYGKIYAQTKIEYSKGVSTCEELFNCENPTAECNDGTFSCSTNRSGTCSHHNGVLLWLY